MIASLGFVVLPAPPVLAPLGQYFGEADPAHAPAFACRPSERAVLAVLQEMRTATRVQIEQATGLGKKTVGNALSALQRESRVTTAIPSRGIYPATYAIWRAA